MLNGESMDSIRTNKEYTVCLLFFTDASHHHIAEEHQENSDCGRSAFVKSRFAICMKTCV